ncbi:DNA cytosine methyltransferase [Ancylomarina euxinus]|uniref:Cytosine-specific methyltransferase n=1 Tax=Ancylomarina euxinus TaxID=2283627 RepID=A0A425Y893_9BACT|nr:DNA cytosine methyltransferase [Ancylomarina euxinus]MCZ4693387.1 DNA cytosine methyltransferase [Ancylomarina euxinus]MUP13615.1 DNA (cytosine-5-)-methyltransferase [Ancylomarina euxinus]RRG24741.1 DNA cytosine methyltransferase [Ancylomarina euxinus]
MDRKSTINTTKIKGLKALSFFSGAMGLDIGLHRSGINTLLACEVDKSCRETIIANNPDIGLIGDIRNYSIQDILDFANIENKEDVDIIVGGPPCQAFSTAGKRMGLADERGNVFLKYIDVIEQIKPKYAVIENVRGLLSSNFSIELDNFDSQFLSSEVKDIKGSTMIYILNRLKAAGYKVTFNLYNSANYGTPQCRERVIIICTNKDKPMPHLQPTNSEKGDFDLPKWKVLKEALNNFPTSTTHQYIKFPEKRLKYYRLLKAGQNWRNLSIELQKEALGKSYYLGGGKTGFLRRLSWEKPSPTLVTHPAMPATDLGHPDEDRPLSIQEYKRIQEFPDNWELKGNLVQQYKQIGNAVPISVGAAIGRTILNHKNDICQQSFDGFKYSRYKHTNEVEFVVDFIKRSEKSLKTMELDNQTTIW